VVRTDQNKKIWLVGTSRSDYGYIEKSTLRGVTREEFIEPDRIILFKTFVKEKKDADGNF